MQNRHPPKKKQRTGSVMDESSGKNLQLSAVSSAEQPFLFQALPSDLQHFIASFWPARTLLRLACVSSGMRFFTNDDRKWVALLKKDFGLDYEKFIALISENLNTGQKPSPKLLYRFRNLINIFYQKYCEAAEKNNLAFCDPFILSSSFPQAGSSLNYVVQYQEFRLTSQGIDITSACELSRLLRRIYELAEGNFELAFLLLSDNSSLNNSEHVYVSNKVIVSCLLRAHLARFKTLDLTWLSFSINTFDYLELLKQTQCKEVTTLILDINIAASSGLAPFINAMPNLGTLRVKCNNLDDFKLYTQDEDGIEIWQSLLQKTHLTEIIITNNINSQTHSFTSNDLKTHYLCN